MSNQNELTDKELKEFVEQSVTRIEEIEEMFPVKGNFMYGVSSALPLVSMLITTVLTVAGNKDGAFNMLWISLICLALYRIDRVFEYIKVRFYLYDTLFTLEENTENEQSTEN